MAHTHHGAAILVLSAAISTMLVSCAGGTRAEHFNSMASNDESQPARVVGNLQLKPGDTVADIGAGGGYFSLLMARMVGPSGRIYAVDIDRRMLEHIDALAKKEGMENIITAEATESSVGIPDRCADMIFMRNVFHHLREDPGYFARLKRYLKPGGRIAIIDYCKAGLLQRLSGHVVSEAEIVSLMKSAGYRVSERFDFLAIQSFNIFVPADGH
ncbi:MAG: class I SAM-dependent methyltransferase [Spirochaetes bacterium]|nr:class I SAM-dependent methyltransferase [Spirochaetota bacterium]